MLYSKDLVLTTTSATPVEVFSVPQGHVAHWTLLFVSNHGGSTNTIDVLIRKSGGSEIYLLEGYSTSSKEFLQFSDATIVLQEGDSVEANIGSNGDVAVICTFDLLQQSPTFVNFNGA